MWLEEYFKWGRSVEAYAVVEDYLLIHHFLQNDGATLLTKGILFQEIMLFSWGIKLIVLIGDGSRSKRQCHLDKT